MIVIFIIDFTYIKEDTIRNSEKIEEEIGKE